MQMGNVAEVAILICHLRLISGSEMALRLQRIRLLSDSCHGARTDFVTGTETVFFVLAPYVLRENVYVLTVGQVVH